MADTRNRRLGYSAGAVALLGLLVAIAVARTNRKELDLASLPPAVKVARESGRTPEASSLSTDLSRELASKKEQEIAPQPVAPSRSPREDFERAGTWEERRGVIQAIRATNADAQRNFLLEVLEGKDVDSVRFAALDKLEECAKGQASTLWLASKLSERLGVEPRRVLRYGTLTALSHLYEDHPVENSFVFDIMVQSLSRDAEGSVRGNAASVLGVYFDSARAVPVLTSALEAEPDAKVRAEIERALIQARRTKR
jgi:hypothetical protein